MSTFQTINRDIDQTMKSEMNVDSRFTSHSLFPLLTQLLQCRSTTCFTFRSADIQSILNQISTLFQSFSPSFSSATTTTSSSSCSYEDHDKVTMTLLHGCVLIVLQILEVYERTIELETTLSNLCPLTTTPPSPLSTSNFTSSLSQTFYPFTSFTSLVSSSEENPANKLKRNNHPPEVTNLLKAWVLKHETHPYPDEEQKQVLCQLTHLTREQLDHWFINARRRFLKSTTHTLPPVSSYFSFPSCPSSSSSSSSSSCSSSSSSMTSSFSNTSAAPDLTPSFNSLH